MTTAIATYQGKVTLGTVTVVGMGTWSLGGVTTEEFDASAFGSNWKEFKYGMKDGGTVSFNGYYDPTDYTGQNVLLLAQLANTALTSLRLYYNATSYFEACQTVGWFAPNTWSVNQDTIASSVRVTSVTIGADKSGLATISFEGKVSGCMVKVN
jgi:hypothetical protein